MGNEISSTSSVGPIESDALRANLLETAAGKVEIDSELELLLNVVKDYKGIHSSLEKILYEVCHPYRNWKMILPQLRSFVLKNSGRYKVHGQGPEAFNLLSGLFFEALEESQRDSELLSQVITAKLAWIDKMITLFNKGDLERFGDALNMMFNRLQEFDREDDTILMHIVHGQHPVKRLAAKLASFGTDEEINYDYLPLASLLRAVLRKNYEYWLREEDPEQWINDHCEAVNNDSRCNEIFGSIAHRSMRAHMAELDESDSSDRTCHHVEFLLKLPGHVDIVRLYRDIPNALIGAEKSLQTSFDDPKSLNQFIENQKLLFLFRIMDTSGLYLIHEETLREINRSLVKLIRQQSFEEIEDFLLTTFQLLKANVRKYPHTSLQCIQVLGGEVFDRGNSRMVEAFLWGLVRFGFQHANVEGVDEDWQPLLNPAHLSNIRVWLHLIMREPKWCGTLFSALIINLKLAGTCVKDTDLFQRDITELLNHPIEPIYNLSKQFTKLMPVFYNEIGSEGELRDVSTELDEIHRRKDLLIHFLRKQAHVESSNLIVDFIDAIFRFWKTGEKQLIWSYLPEEVYRQIDPVGDFVDDQFVLSERVWEEFQISESGDLIFIDSEDLADFLTLQDDLAPHEVRRFELLVKMYKLLFQKYELGFQEIQIELQQAIHDGFTEVEPVLQVLKSKEDPEKCLEVILQSLDELKRIILSDQKFEAREDIYYKRHIAVDIPSVYGRYKEKKFDALSLTFRLENLANIYLEKLPQTVNLAFITQATFWNIVRCLRIFMRALKIDGITSRRLKTYLSLLESSLKVRRFSYTQYLDIFRGLSEGVKDIIYAYYTNIHQNNLSIIIPQIGRENLLLKYKGLYDDEDVNTSVQQLSEAFMRELISETFGLQHLDNFILRIIQTLESQKDKLNEQHLDLLMTYNQEKAISHLDNPNPYSHNLIYLGNKGFNLATLIREGIPVPPAFALTTEVFRCRDIVFGYTQAREELVKHVRQALTQVEEQTGRIYGSSDCPLLLSVRSGGAISMPGMMATVHNVGFNEDIIEEYVNKGGNEYVAWDNYRRFLQSWAMMSGVGREDFQVLMNEAKDTHGVSLKRQFSAGQMRELALSYQRLVRQKGLGIPDDPWLQLMYAVELVLDSWGNHKASDYRKILDVSDSWGTAVIVQAMVFGNKSGDAGSGVVFTAHPYRKVQRVALWGDYAYGDQGEDIVSGLVTSCAISVEQAELDGRKVEETLERRFPEIYNKLLLISRDLVYEKRWNPQEIEFTFEGPEPDQLYLLQTRDMITIKKKEHLNVFEETPELKKSYLGQGVGVSGSAFTGRAVFTEENIVELRESDPDANLILIRQDTVPEDIKVINSADALLTSRGGQTSHASVVAVRLEKTCVVGVKKLKVYETAQYCEIGKHKIHFGDAVSIDGRNGVVLLGTHKINEEYHILPI